MPLNSMITKNPYKLFGSPSPDEFEASIPSLEHYFSIAEAAHGTEHEIPVLLAGLCGLRRSEVFGLTWNDIDFEEATLTVRQAVVTAEGQLDKKEA